MTWRASEEMEGEVLVQGSDEVPPDQLQVRGGWGNFGDARVYSHLPALRLRTAGKRSGAGLYAVS
jgi:hypothetical protein